LQLECVSTFVANKNDFTSQRQVDAPQMKVFAECHHIELVETSLTSRENRTIASQRLCGKNEIGSMAISIMIRSGRSLERNTGSKTSNTDIAVQIKEDMALIDKTCCQFPKANSIRVSK
jgi:hypothetical protein